MADDAERCPGCRNRLAECTDPQNAKAFEADPLRCFVCETRHIEAMGWRDEPESRRAGLLIPIIRKS